MFNLWNQVTGGGGDDPIQSHFPNQSHHDKNHHNRSLRHNQSMRSNSPSITEDDLADELLSQFPEYGTNLGQLSDDEDFDTDAVNENQEKEDTGVGMVISKDGNDVHKVAAADESRSHFSYTAATTSTTRSNSPSDSNNSIISPIESHVQYSPTTVVPSPTSHWDEDEKDLWKNGNNTNNSMQRRIVSNSLQDSISTNTQLQQQEDQKPSQIHQPPQTPPPLRQQQQSHQNLQLDHFQNLQNQKEYWMPDSLCKVCYACETQFTVFRRRHHCRLCGQVFCSNCSAYFVELAPDPSNFRKVLHQKQQQQQQQQQQQKQKQTQQQQKIQSSSQGSGNSAQLPNSNNNNHNNHRRRQKQKRTLRACKMCFDQVYSSSSSHAALYGVGSRAAAGRWGNESDDEDESMMSTMQETSVHSVTKIPSQHPASHKKKHRKTFSLTGAEIRTDFSNSSTNSSVGKGTNSNTPPTQNTRHHHTNLPPHHDPNNISMTASGMNDPSIGSAFLNQDQDSYDESSFQALNLTKQKLQERTAAALKEAARHAPTPERPDLFLLRERERQEKELEEEENDSVFPLELGKKHNGGLGGSRSSRSSNGDEKNEWNENSTDSANSTLLQILMQQRRLEKAAEKAAEKALNSGGGGDGGVGIKGIDNGDNAEFESIGIFSKRDSSRYHPNEGSVHGSKMFSSLNSKRFKPLERILSVQSGCESEDAQYDNNIDSHNRENVLPEERNPSPPPPPSVNRKIGELAAAHLEQMTKELLASDAPLLLEEFPDEKWLNWIHVLLSLVTRACTTVMPDVKGGDFLDIRPYCKVKVIAGGSPRDCAYVSGVVFHKNVSHKRMAKEINNPRIMLLSGGIEYTRKANRIASIETLLEQEDKYMEILVAKIIKLSPSVLLVGRSVNRQAQELLLNANVVLIQHVKSELMQRIARQTGATILSSTDHVMNQFGTSVLGRCHRFRLVSFRDKEAWSERYTQYQRVAHVRNGRFSPKKTDPVSAMMKNLQNHQRQAVLAANRLGESAMDGSEAVKSGLAKRGIVRTYVMLEGCPKKLGSTVILRGASRATLKQLKRVFTFLLSVGYNLKLETNYYRERRVCLPADFKRPDLPIQTSSSLCVDYGKHPLGKKNRPWNGALDNVTNPKMDLSRSISGKISALDHQSILITSVWMTENTQCCPAEVKGISYYSLQDVSLGQFLRDSCFNLDLKCQNPTCKKSVLDHSLSFVHNDGRINITVERMDDSLPPAPCKPCRPELSTSNFKNKSSKDEKSSEPKSDPIATWTYCTNCCKVVTPLVYISDETWQLSFGKFIEIYFYNKDFQMHCPDGGCTCKMQSAAILYFGCGNLAVRFTYEKIEPYNVFIRKSLPFDEDFHLQAALAHLEKISSASSSLFLKFDKHVERVSREVRHFLASKTHKSEHLKSLLSEVNLIRSEIDYAANTLQEKIATVTQSRLENSKYGGNEKKLGDSALIRFPWHARRYLALLTSVWNERLSAVGQVLTVMKKQAASSQSKSSNGRGEIAVVGMNAAANAIVGDGYGSSSEDIIEAMKRLKQVKELYSQHNVRDMDIRSYSDHIASKSHQSVSLNDSIHDKRQYRGSHRSPSVGNEYHEYEDEMNDDLENDMLDFTGHEFDSLMLDEGQDSASIYSRRRQRQKNDDGSISLRPTKSLGTRRPLDIHNSHSRPPQPHGTSSRPLPIMSSESTPPLVAPPQEAMKNKAVTPGGAVKSALTRFFNRGSKVSDSYIVDLGMFSEGCPRLEPGIGGLVTPVYEDQPSTIIAHSLSSEDYYTQFKKFENAEREVPDDESSIPSKTIRGKSQEERRDIERRMLVRNKAHVKHTFKEFDAKGKQICKYICTSFWATQFHAVRQAFLSSTNKESGKENHVNSEQTYIQSLSASNSWAASGGKSGASFSKTNDGRFVVKCMSRTELQMFLDCAPAYFEYLSKAFFHGLPSILCKILGVYQIGYTNRETGKRTMEQVTVMQNIWYGRKVSITFDLKGTKRGRFAKLLDKDKKKSKVDASDREADTNKLSSKKKYINKDLKRENDETSSVSSNASDTIDSEFSSVKSADVDEETISNDSITRNEKKQGNENINPTAGQTLLDGDFLEFTEGRPLPLSDRSKALFHMSILNDTLFLSIINVLDYSLVIGIDDEKKELIVGIIDFMRQYDILKQMERVGKSIPMVVGSEAPTIIQPPLYKTRFTNAMERYFMTVPNKWTTM